MSLVERVHHGQISAAGATGTPDIIPEPFHLGRVSLLAAGHWVHDSYTAFLAPMLIVFKETLALSNAQAGLLSVFMQEASLFQPLIGGIADRRGARYFVALAPLVTGAVMSVIGLAPNYLTLAILLTIVAFSHSCIHAVGPVLTSDAAGSKLGLGMSLWAVGGESGRFVGPLVVGYMLRVSSVKQMPWLMIGGIVASIALVIMLRDSDELTSSTRAESPRIKVRELFRGRGRVLAPIISVIVLQAFIRASLNTYLPLMLSSEGETIWMASVAVAVLQAAGIAGALLGGTQSDRFGRRTTLIATILPTSLLMFIFLLTSGWVRFPLLIIMGATSMSIMPVIMAVVLETFPESKALANGSYFAFSFVVSSSVILILGWLGDAFGLHTAFATGATVPLLGLPLLLTLPRQQTRSMS